MRIQRAAVALTATLALACTATACGGAKPAADNAGSGSKPLSGQTVSVAAAWTGVEQKNFQQVLDAFTAKTGAKTVYISTGDNVSTLVGSKIEGGDPPDVVMMPQLGVLQQFARKGWLEPLAPAVADRLNRDFAKIWADYGTVDGKLYGLYFKAAHKSTVWYSPSALDAAGVKPPTTFDQLLTAGRAVSDSGLPAFSVAGESGWPLTDWFENVYLSQAGPENYDKLAKHQIPWTHPTVVNALTALGKLFGDQQLVAGGGKGALQTDFPESVQQVFGDKPKAAMVYEGDFVGAIVSGELKKKVGQDARFFPFPAVDGGKPPVVGGGDAAVVLKGAKHKDAAQQLLEFLATPEAAGVWAKAGGFLSPNKALKTDGYPDETTRQTAESLIAAADTFRFDLSDQAPAAFGGTQGSGEWKILQDFLANPADVNGTAQRLEAAAAAAYQG
ncbi:ABC transporter substrate-binding protein [Kitasatospora atroaurantiaca]|uniref:Carbohydrate ABC transporter substrate-binding protein (CUT1 family) n=1 Tax=Kitasatospora atroaurantiaca TaxID=285545 RepID=A0A561EZM2_9ACTN|nr:ABC transporter substrate-binding protein [Kitasatospora atroaurantiaca]TWE21059.1 carbohydrate ABC transporter substrate-binding protein (CUT1 family) [Kitasatospora atroaurantiaca]